MSLELGIYLMEACGNLKCVTGVVGFFASIGCGIWFFNSIHDHSCFGEGPYKFPSLLKRAIALCFFTSLVSLVIPSERTVKSIIAIKFLKENKEQITALPHDIKDYILEFAKDLKNVLKDEKK